MMISNALMAETSELPPLGDVLYQYVVAANGLFIRAEDSRSVALVKVASARLTGLVDLVPGAHLKVERVSGLWLLSMLRSARRNMPNEAMYQLLFTADPAKPWICQMPDQIGSPTALRFADDGRAVIDLHSHNSMAAFFSDTDNADEQGFRFYAVIGRIDTPRPEIRVRVGVYGHHLAVPATTVFADLGPFVDRYGEYNSPAYLELERSILEAA